MYSIFMIGKNRSPQDTVHIIIPIGHKKDFLDITVMHSVGHEMILRKHVVRQSVCS